MCVCVQDTARVRHAEPVLEQRPTASRVVAARGQISERLFFRALKGVCVERDRLGLHL